MKRQELLRKISKAAKANHTDWMMVRQGGNHEIWQCGVTKVTLPRHIEINELTAQGIMRTLDTELGKDWWR